MSLRIRWAVLGAVGGMFLAGLALLILRFTGALVVSSSSQILDAPAAVHQIQRLNELVAVKYTVQKVVGIEEKQVPLGSEKLLLFVQAEVLAGIDLSAISP